MLTTSVSLLNRLQHLNDEAWKRFVNIYTPVLFVWARKMNLPDGDAQDLVQDLFMLLFNKLPEFTYNPKMRFRSWLRTVACNRFRDFHKRRHVPTVDLHDVAAEADPFWETEFRRHIGLWATSITDAGLANFDGTDQITYLVLANTKVTDKGLAYFRNSKNIYFLKLSHTRITDAGLANFAHCNNLQELHLAGTSVSKSGLAHLKDCKKLTNAYLDQTGLGDECVELIGHWKKLTFLDIRGTKFTAEGIARLQILLSECQFGSSINAQEINKALKRIQKNR